MKRTRSNTADPSTGYNNQKPALYMPKPNTEQYTYTGDNNADLPHNESGGTHIFAESDVPSPADLSYNMGDDEVTSHRMRPAEFVKKEARVPWYNDEDSCLRD